jgi:hypothetical protein
LQQTTIKGGGAVLSRQPFFGRQSLLTNNTIFGQELPPARKTEIPGQRREEEEKDQSLVAF